MLEVLFASLCDFLTRAIRSERFHAGAQEGLTTEEWGVGLPVREHDHISVVNAVTLRSMLIFGLIEQSPVISQIL